MPAVNAVIDYRAANVYIKNVEIMKVKKQKPILLASAHAE